MATRKTSPTIRLRVVVVSPPTGVVFAVQRGRADLLAPTAVREGSIQFDLELRVGEALADGSPNYLGEFAQGTPADRFVYINSGTLAGQPDTEWTRRAKLKLASMPAEMVQAAMGQPRRFVEARVRGTMADGGPVCASVKPDAVTWTLSKSAA